MAKYSAKQTTVSQLGTYDQESGDLNVIIETPQGSRNKFKYDEDAGVFKLSAVLPKGIEFPYDFGYVPGTRGDDGDPLDVLVLMDAPAFAGCLVSVRLIGVIQADQTEEEGETVQNDRLVGVAVDSYTHRDVKTLGQLSPHLLEELEHFFKSYTELRGKQFKPRGRAGPERANQIVKDGMQREQQQTKANSKKRAK